MVGTPAREASISARFPAESSSAAAARRFVGDALDDWGCSAFVEIARLLVSELVTNVLLHAGTALEVRMTVVRGVLRVEVHDWAMSRPSRKYYAPTSATGRGLMMVEAMAQRWGNKPTPDGKVVWFELEEPGAGGSSKDLC